jgi:phospholipid N-methyltransferase
MSKKVKNSLKDSALFLKHAITSPMQVAYFMPSSPWLIDQVAQCAHLKDAKYIMELGPGTGGTTRGILKYMQPDAELISVEINQKFIDHIEKTILDERLSMSNRGAQNLVDIMADHDWQSADVIISGIPFTTLPKGMDRDIMKSIHEALKPGGIFLAYQFRDHVSKLAQPLFGEYTFKKVEFKNIPPMRIYTWQK